MPEYLRLNSLDFKSSLPDIIRHIPIKMNAQKMPQQINGHNLTEVKEQWFDFADQEFIDISGSLKSGKLPAVSYPEVPVQKDKNIKPEDDQEYKLKMKFYEVQMKHLLDQGQQRETACAKLCIMLNVRALTPALRTELNKNSKYVTALENRNPMEMWAEIESRCELGGQHFAFDVVATSLVAALNSAKMSGESTSEKVNAYEKECFDRYSFVKNQIDAANKQDTKPLDASHLATIHSFLERLFVANMVQGYASTMSTSIRHDISNPHKSVQQPLTFVQAAELSQNYVRVSDTETRLRIPHCAKTDSVVAAACMVEGSIPGPKTPNKKEAARITKLLAEKSPEQIATALVVERANAARARGNGRVKAMAGAINSKTKEQEGQKQNQRKSFTDKSKKPNSIDNKGWTLSPENTKWCEKHKKWGGHGTAKCTLQTETALIALVDSAECAPPSSSEELPPPHWALIGA